MAPPSDPAAPPDRSLRSGLSLRPVGRGRADQPVPPPDVSVDDPPVVGQGAGAGAGSGAGAGAGGGAAGAGAGCAAGAAFGAALRAAGRFFGLVAFLAVRLDAFLATTFFLVARFADFFRTRFFVFAFDLALLLALPDFRFAFLAMWVAPLLRWSNRHDSSGHVANLRDSSRRPKRDNLPTDGPALGVSGVQDQPPNWRAY